MTVTADGVTLQVTALRDDILRVRMWKGDAVPEDASWAVLPAARASTIPVTGEAHGFTTNALRVSVDDRLGLTVSDRQGSVLQKDAAPVRWDGNRFSIVKQLTPGDHFFGLRDKPRPLDRGGQGHQSPAEIHLRGRAAGRRRIPLPCTSRSRKAGLQPSGSKPKITGARSFIHSPAWAGNNSNRRRRTGGGYRPPSRTS